MTPGIGLAIGAMFFFAIGDVIYKRAAANGIGASQFIMLQAWAFCPGVTLYAWATGKLDVHLSALWGGLAGFCALVALYNFASSLKQGAVSTNAPIFRLNFTITAALAILLLGEVLSPGKAAAVACALGAVWLILVEPRAAAVRPSAASLARVIIATVAMGLANLFYKIGLQHGALPETMVSAQAWVFCSLATVFNWWPERRLRIPPGAWRYSTLVAVTQVFGFLLLLHGLMLGPASVLVPVAQMGFVITSLFGVILFKEILTTRKIAGLLVGVAALALFAIS
jgi:drug/metabolite transporter (DMT)-like permease